MTSKYLPFLRFFWLLALLSLGTIAFKNNSIQFDLLALLPDSKTEKMSRVKSFMEDAGFSKQVVILLGHPHQDKAQQALQKLRHSIQETELPLREKEAKKTQQEIKDFFQALYPYHAFFLSQKDRYLLQKNQEDEIVERALQELTSPFGTLGAPNLKSDPFFLFPRYVLALQTQNSLEMDLETGDAFIKDQGQFWYIYHAHLDQPLFSLKLQEKLSNTLTPLIDSLDVETLKTGAIFYAAAGASQAKNEISAFGGVSALLIIVLLLFVFRSLAPLGFALLVITSGLVGGVSFASLIFGSLHILALVFGASLIGVCVDYALHYYCAHLHVKRTSDFSVLKSLIPALPLGVLSSCIGYGLLTLVPFPGIQQMATLAASGLLSAFITVVLWGPTLLKKPPQGPPVFAQKIQDTLDGFAKISLNRTVLTIAILVPSFVGIHTLTFDDNVRHFQSLNQELKSQEHQIQTKMHLTQSPTFFTVSAANLEDLLQQEEKIIDQLDRLKISYQSLTTLVPSQKRQLENQRLIQDNLVIPHLKTLFKTLKIPPLKTSGAIPPVLEKVPQLPKIWRSLLSQEKNNFHGRILIPTPQNSDDLYKIAAQYDNVIYSDPPQEYSALFMEYRILMMKVIFAVFSIIILFLSLFKGPKAAFKITIPVLFSLLLTLSIFSFMGIALTLFHIMGLLLVLCIGIDYALFLYWRKKAPHTKDCCLLANAMAALTTLFSFGMLALSNTAAVQGFGLSVFMGIILSFVMTTLYLGRK